MDLWVTVLFTDESRFSLTSDSLHTSIWGDPRTRDLPSNVQGINHYGSGGLMVCAGITLGVRTQLHTSMSLKETVTVLRYKDETFSGGQLELISF
ncbi:HTH_Tnp_Tc3_2 domain-containing protein [Trichonephila clavipes]|nr:HTH_Tnp_Tc3_2 domain-containing protein [Trichonephila clavipes]